MTPESQMQGGYQSGGGQSSDDQQDPSRGINDQLRQLTMTIGQLAQQAPEVQQELQMAAKALTAAQLKLVSSTRDQSQGQPVVAS